MKFDYLVNRILVNESKQLGNPNLKFDHIANQLLVNEGVRLGIPKNLNFEKRPEQALSTLSDSYREIMNINVGRYNNADAFGLIALNKEIGEELNVVLYVLKKSNVDNYNVNDGQRDLQLSKEDLVKNVINKLQQLHAKDKPKFPVPSDATNESGEPVHDAFGNTIPRGTELNSGDYRLSMFQNTREVKKWGGVELWHHMFKELLSMLGLQYQVYRRREESKNVTADEGEDAITNHVIYYWGENYLPYRTVLKVNKEGKIVRHRRLIEKEVDPKAGSAFWKTDRMFNKYEKADPIAVIGPKGSYDGTILYEKTPEEIKNILQKNDFPVIINEVRSILNMSDDDKRRLYERQQALFAMSPQEKVEKYFELMEVYEGSLRLRGRKRQPLDYTAPEDWFYPFFTVIVENNGRYMARGVSAEKKFKLLWPESDFGKTLYTNR